MLDQGEFETGQMKERYGLFAETERSKAYSNPFEQGKLDLKRKQTERIIATSDMIKQMIELKYSKADIKEATDKRVALDHAATDAEALEFKGTNAYNAKISAMQSQGSITAAKDILAGNTRASISDSASQQLEILAEQKEHMFDMKTDAGKLAYKKAGESIQAQRDVQLRQWDFGATQTTNQFSSGATVAALSGSGQTTAANRESLKYTANARQAQAEFTYGVGSPQALAAQKYGQSEQAGFEQNKKHLDMLSQFDLSSSIKSQQLDNAYMPFAAESYNIASSGASAILANRDNDPAAKIKNRQIAELTKQKLLGQNKNLVDMNAFGQAQEVGRGVALSAMADRDPTHDENKIAQTIAANKKMIAAMDDFKAGKIDGKGLKDALGKIDASGGAANGDDGKDAGDKIQDVVDSIKTFMSWMQSKIGV